MCKLSLRSLLAAAVMVAIGGQVQARHVMHPVKPENIDKQPYAFELKVKDINKGEKSEFVEFEIRVLVKAGKKSPGPNAHGRIGISQVGAEKVKTPTVTMVNAGEATTFTFRIPRDYVNRAEFTFVDFREDAQHPFPAPGDYWVFKLADFANGK